MASTNQSPQYKKAEAKFLSAKTNEEKMILLEEMIRECPKHKSSEKMLANLKTRYKKLKESSLKERKSKASKQGIKKQGIQVALIGLTNSGKSSLLANLTNAQPEISEHEFTTQKPTIGTLNYAGVSFQIIDMPAVNYETFDQGLANGADILLIIITNLDEIKKIEPFLENAEGKKIIVFNKLDLLSLQEQRRIEATLSSKKFNYILISTTKYANKASSNIDELKELKQKILENSNIIRIYTKHPGKKSKKDDKPIILQPGSIVKDLAEKIFHSKIKIKEVKITGPSSRFPNQIVGLNHILKDKDVVEFRIR